MNCEKRVGIGCLLEQVSDMSEELPEGFEEWFAKRGVWPRITYAEAYKAGLEQGRQQGVLDTIKYIENRLEVDGTLAVLLDILSNKAAEPPKEEKA